MPKKGKDALPGLVGVTPPSGVITWDPVSVCQYVYPVISYETTLLYVQLTSTI